MAASSSRKPTAFSASRQVAFHQLLVAARKTVLGDALRVAVSTVDPQQLSKQIATYAPRDVRKILAAAGVRDEYVFPTPLVLEAQPTLVGYYRLLLGVSQKRFYRSQTGMSQFRSMEFLGTLRESPREQLPAFCKAMGRSLSDLVRQLSPSVTTRDVDELSLLTLGAQFQGGNNVSIGKQATLDGFLAIADTVRSHVQEHTQRKLSVLNASGRRVVLTLSGDPDVRIEEDFAGELRKKVAIEIKGGTDVSNVHNRAGEAEKSHQKARREGFVDCWTIIQTKGVSIPKLESESPTTNAWFDAAQVLGRSGPDWDTFRNRIAEAVGIPLD